MFEKKLDYTQVPSPCFVLDEARLRRNMEILDDIQKRGNVKIICALKGYSFWRSFPIIREYLAGATASSLNEARLAKEEMRKEVHVFAPVYEDDEIDQILSCAGHITFNSFSQWQRFKDKTLAAGVSAGIRVNPQFSTVETDLFRDSESPKQSSNRNSWTASKGCTSTPSANRTPTHWRACSKLSNNISASTCPK